MTETSTIRGRVVDALAEPLPGAEVVVTRREDGREIVRTLTDRGGRYELEVPHESITVTASAPRKAPAQQPRHPGAERPGWEPGDFRLWDAGRVIVHVRDADGAPIADASVLPVGGDAAIEGRTDAKGEVSCDLPLGWAGLAVWAPGYALAQRELVLEDDAVVDVTLARDARVAVLVRVADVPAGRTVKVSLRAYARADGMPLPPPVAGGILDARGEWRATGLPRWRFQVDLHAEGLRIDAVEPSAGAISGDAGEEAAAFAFRAVVREHLSLHGVLRDMEGRPVANALLEDSDWNSATTDGEGRFVFQGEYVRGETLSLRLMSDRLHLESEHESPAPHDLPEPDQSLWPWTMRMINGERLDVVVDPSQPVQLRAAPTARLEGSVVDARGCPVPACLVHLNASSTSSRWAHIGSATTDADGAFAFASPLLVGRELRVRCEGYMQRMSRGLRVGAGETVSGLRLVLEDGNAPRAEQIETAIVEGVVRDGAGRALSGAMAVLNTWYPRRNARHEPVQVPHEERQRRAVHANRDGRFRFVGVRPGTWFVTVTRGSEEASASTAAFEVASGNRVVVDVLISRGA